MLPILTVLFLISYGLMTLLIVEQGSTIQSQRTLIQQLLGDSTELSALKGKAIQQQAQAPKAQAEAQSSPSSDSVDPGSTGSTVRENQHRAQSQQSATTQARNAARAGLGYWRCS